MSAKKVLVCDDDDAVSTLIRTILSSAGILTLGAADGDEGLTAIREERPDCVVLDLNMPGKDGLTVLQQLNDSRATLPYVIVVSAHESAAMHARARALGAREIVVKPFNMVELIERIKTALGAAPT